MPDKTLFIARNDVAEKRKKIGKVKDLLDQKGDDFNEFEYYISNKENNA